ncbi:flavodoxin [Clostridium sp.]|uniref:flavodoxin n=1 Tax=Clostridium sp. TaxID=1506 RepID=UPI00261988FF|nr:flavodoxin [Clostridium sp.]
MNKVSIIYWSNGGNVEILANSILEGIKAKDAEVKIKYVSDATIEDVIESDTVAFGSPSMDNNRIEQEEMEPFITKLKLVSNNNKKLVLFGSFGWDDGKFMNDWVQRMKDYGFNVIGHIAVKETPSNDELLKAKELGELLAE